MTGLQKAIYEFVKSKGRATREEVRKRFSLPEPEMQRQLAMVRHCELVGGHKEDGKVYLIPFSYEGIGSYVPRDDMSNT